MDDELARIVERLSTVDDPKTLIAGLISSASVGFAVYGTDGHCLFVNQAFRDLFGDAPPPAYNIFEDDILKERGMVELIRQAFSGTTTVMPAQWYDPRNLRNVKVDIGRRVAIQVKLFPLPAADGVIRHVAVCFKDVTSELELAATTNDLRISESNYRAIFENAGDGIVVYDMVTGTMVEANDRACEITGFSRAELMTSQPGDHVGDDPNYTLQDLERRIRLAHAGEPQIFEWRARHHSGRSYWMEISMRNATIQGKALLVSFLRDVSDRKQLEETLRQTEDRLRQAQKMEAIGRLAGGVAHDFNNLLSVILSYSSLAMHTLDSRTAATAGIEEIRIAGERAARLTKQLLAFSRQQVLQPTIVSLNDIVAGTEGMLRSLLGEDIEIRTAMTPDLGMTKVDPGQIEQVIMNLAVNARDAMPHGGVLTIETANTQLGGEHKNGGAPGTAAGPHVRLSVADTGVGIDSRLHAHIFEPFFTTKERGRGTGLGLATVLGIVEQSGGHVRVDSTPGAGATFRVYFPRCEGNPTPERLPSTTASSLRGTETVLLAEDEEQLRILARTILERNGYHVMTRASSVDTLRLCEQYQGTIHVLITDMIMPEMSGQELAERVVRMRPETKVLYMSGYTDASNQDGQHLRGQAVFLQKPITPGALLTTLREVLDGRAPSIGAAG